MEAKTFHRRVIIDAVKFEGTIHLPDSNREQLVASLEQREFDGDSDWVGELQEVGIRETWLRQGYWTAQVRVEALHLNGDSTRQHVLVTVHVDEGLQYRLGDIRFREASGTADPTVFRPDELRKLVPLRERELFNVEKIREGLDALREKCSSGGYIDFVALPVIDIDDHQRISLVMELQEGPQFRVGRIEALGLAPSMESLLKSKLKSGDSFNPKLVDEFYKENKSVLPTDVSPLDVQVDRDLRNGTVNLVFDFRTFPCPQREN